jgi:hypothetical protein
VPDRGAPDDPPAHVGDQERRRHQPVGQVPPGALVGQLGEVVGPGQVRAQAEPEGEAPGFHRPVARPELGLVGRAQLPQPQLAPHAPGG